MYKKIVKSSYLKLFIITLFFSALCFVFLFTGNKLTASASFHKGGYPNYAPVSGYSATINLKDYKGELIETNVVTSVEFNNEGTHGNFFFIVATDDYFDSYGQIFSEDYFNISNKGYNLRSYIYLLSEYNVDDEVVILGRSQSGWFKKVHFDANIYNGATLDFYILRPGETLTAIENTIVSVTVNYAREDYVNNHGLLNVSRTYLLEEGTDLATYVQVGEFSNVFQEAIGYLETNTIVSKTNNVFNVKYDDTDIKRNVSVYLGPDTYGIFKMKAKWLGSVNVSFSESFSRTITANRHFMLGSMPDVAKDNKPIMFYGFVLEMPSYDNTTNSYRTELKTKTYYSLSEIDFSIHPDIYIKLAKKETITVYGILPYMLPDDDSNYTNPPEKEKSFLEKTGNAIGDFFGGIGNGLVDSSGVSNWWKGLKDGFRGVLIGFVVVITGLIIYLAVKRNKK